MSIRTVEKIGVVGYGFAGQLHAQALLGRYDPRNILITDKSPDKQDSARQAGYTVFSTMDLLLAAKPDLIITALPPSENKTTVEKIIHEGATRGILIEKPIALNSEDANLINRMLAKASIFRMAGLTGHGFHPEFKKAKELIDVGTLGHIHTFIEQIHQGGPDLPKHYVTAEYGGAIQELGIHTIDHIHYLLNRHIWGTKLVRGGYDHWENTAPDWCEVSLQIGDTPTDQTIVHASWAFVKDFPAVLDRKNYSTTIVGSKGKMAIYGFDGLEVTTAEGTSKTSFHNPQTNNRDRHLPGFIAEVNAFIDAFELQKPSPVPLRYAAHLQQIIDQIRLTQINQIQG